MKMDSHEQTGEYLCQYFEHSGGDIALMLLDEEKKLLATVDIEGENFGSAAVKPQSFVDRARAMKARFAVIANTHRHGAPFPLPSEIVTSRMVVSALEGEGVWVLEHYIICGSRYHGLTRDMGLGLGREDSQFGVFLKMDDGEERGE